MKSYQKKPTGIESRGDLLEKDDKGYHTETDKSYGKEYKSYQRKPTRIERRGDLLEKHGKGYHTRNKQFHYKRKDYRKNQKLSRNPRELRD